jgi:predicted dehydrogenase
LRIGIVGCGTIAKSHIRALLRFPRLAAVAALNSRSAESMDGAATLVRERAELELARAGDAESRGLLAAQLSAAPRQFAQASALATSPDVDAVIVTTPPFLHHAHCLAALRAGKHVLCEKPLAIGLAQADELIEAARENRVVLATVSQGRYADEQRRMKSLIDGGTLGKVFAAKADTQWHRAPSYYDMWWRGTWEMEGGGALISQAIHVVDQVLWLLDKRPARVTGSMGTFVHPVPVERARGGIPIEDTAYGVVTFDDGSVMEIAAAVSHHLQRSQIELHAERGSIYAYPWELYSIDPMTDEQLQAESAAVQPLPARWISPDAESDAYNRVGNAALPFWSMLPQVGDFLESVHAGRDPLTGGGEGRRALEVVTGFYKAAITGTAVRLPITSDDPYYEGVARALAARP